MIVEYGNTYKEVKNPINENRHEWTMFVRLVGEHKGKESKLIEKVRFGLSETSIVDHRIVKPTANQNLQITYRGWGYFNVPITIYWSKQSGIKEPMELNHMLCFEGNGKWTQVV